MKELPPFKRMGHTHIQRLLSEVFIHPRDLETSYFRRLVEFDDGHYGAVFDLDYFAGAETPTKSQWNTLKKKLKRHDKRIFVLKEHGVTTCHEDAQELRCGVIEFGFFAH